MVIHGFQCIAVFWHKPQEMSWSLPFTYEERITRLSGSDAFTTGNWLGHWHSHTQPLWKVSGKCPLFSACLKVANVSFGWMEIKKEDRKLLSDTFLFQVPFSFIVRRFYCCMLQISNLQVRFSIPCFCCSYHVTAIALHVSLWNMQSQANLSLSLS